MIWSVLLLAPLCVALPSLHNRRGASNDASIRPIFQFPNDTWIENIHVRSNGKLLVTTLNEPALYQIDPVAQNTTPQVVATFSNAISVLGIEEVEEDVFAVTTGNFSLATENIALNSFSVWKADLTKGLPGVVSLIANVAEASVLNGITINRKGGEYLLIADSLGGVVWRVNLGDGKYDVVLNETATQPIGEFPSGWGVNGVLAVDNFLYFTNTNIGFFRVPINNDGTKAGAVEAIANVTGWDDFTRTENGDMYLSQGQLHQISKVTPNGEVATLDYVNPDGLVLIEGNTAMKFGRTKCDKSILYVTTNGGMTGVVNGTAVQGGRVLALDLHH